MSYAKVLQFALVALRAIVAQLDPASAAAVLGAQTLNMIELAVKYSGLSPSPLQATMPPNAFKGVTLPDQPWTPERLLDWAEHHQFATPLDPPA